MAIIDLNKYGVGLSLRGEMHRSHEILLKHPNGGANWFPDLVDGIYQMPRYSYGKVCRRIDFYEYVITHTEAQQTNREKFADAVVAWQSLTQEQKKQYNQSTHGKHMSGYNLFLGKYLKSH